MSFSLENRKLRFLFNNLQQAKTDLETLRNEELLLNFFKASNQTFFVLDETEWLPQSATGINAKTIRKGDLLPETFSITYTKQFSLPPLFVPFVDTRILIHNIPGAALRTFAPYITEEYTGSNAIIRGDDSILYSGGFATLAGPVFDLTVSNAELNNPVPENNTKKIFRLTITWNDPIHGFLRITNGELTEINTAENTQFCDSNSIADTFETAPTEESSGYSGSHKILEFSASSFSAIGDFTERNFNLPSPHCTVDSVVTEDTSFSRSFGILDSYSFLVIGNVVKLSDDTVLPVDGFLVPNDEITSIEDVTQEQNRVYYNSFTKRSIQYSNISNEIVLSNFPATTDDGGRTYTTITLERNLEPLSETLTPETTSVISEDTIFSNNDLPQTYKTIYKVPDNDNLYYIKATFEVRTMAPALVDDPNPDIPTQSDIYTQSGSIYARTTNIDGFVSEAFITENNDIQYKVLLIVKNPFRQQEIRKYVTP